MANRLILKRSSVAGKVPLATDLSVGELAVNLADAKLYSKDAGGNVISVGGGSSLPTQTGNSGKFLTTDGSTPSWGAVAWAGITSKPTTLSGYGITDAAPSSHVGSGGTSHANATTTTAGFMSSTDKSKLDGIASGATANTGTVTSVGGTGTVSGLSLSGTVTTSGNLTLSGTLSVTPSNFASQTANYILAAPNGAAGVPTFRALVAADIPTLNQNTTGSAGSVAWSGVTGKPTTLSGYGITDAAPSTGSTSITTLGTIATGTWNASTISVANGGTGATTLTGLVYGNGTSAMTAATAAQIVAAIGTTAVANATNADTLDSLHSSAFARAGAGGSIVEMPGTISANYSITSGSNGMSAGPISVANGVTVTVPNGSTWVIV